MRHIQNNQILTLHLLIKKMQDKILSVILQQLAPKTVLHDVLTTVHLDHDRQRKHKIILHKRAANKNNK